MEAADETVSIDPQRPRDIGGEHLQYPERMNLFTIRCITHEMSKPRYLCVHRRVIHRQQLHPSLGHLSPLAFERRISDS